MSIKFPCGLDADELMRQGPITAEFYFLKAMEIVYNRFDCHGLSYDQVYAKYSALVNKLIDASALDFAATMNTSGLELLAKSIETRDLA